MTKIAPFPPILLAPEWETNRIDFAPKVERFSMTMIQVVGESWSLGWNCSIRERLNLGRRMTSLGSSSWALIDPAGRKGNEKILYIWWKWNLGESATPARVDFPFISSLEWNDEPGLESLHASIYIQNGLLPDFKVCSRDPTSWPDLTELGIHTKISNYCGFRRLFPFSHVLITFPFVARNVKMSKCWWSFHFRA